jgi:hypothetical protein
MYMKADLLNDICEIQSGEGEVLQGSSETPVCSRIGHGITLSSKQLCLSVDRSRTRLAICLPGHIVVGEEEDQTSKAH